MNDYLLLKRIFDIVFSFIVFFLILPIFILIIIILLISQGIPIFFLQERVGKDMKIFNIIKFRTMINNAINEGKGIHVEEDDKRMTIIGKILRKYSIDELPQLINVLKDDMSIVGPRPPVTFYPKMIEKYDKNEKKRFSIKPGLTGYAQINGRNNITWEERFYYDNLYIKKANLNLDIFIIIKTVFSGTVVAYVANSKK